MLKQMLSSDDHDMRRRLDLHCCLSGSSPDPNVLGDLVVIVALMKFLEIFIKSPTDLHDMVYIIEIQSPTMRTCQLSCCR